MHVIRSARILEVPAGCPALPHTSPSLPAKACAIVRCPWCLRTRIKRLSPTRVVSRPRLLSCGPFALPHRQGGTFLAQHGGSGAAREPEEEFLELGMETSGMGAAAQHRAWPACVRPWAGCPAPLAPKGPSVSMPSPGAMSHQNKFHSVTRPTHSLFVWQGKQIGGHFLLPEKVTSCDAPLALRRLKAFVLPRTSAPTGATPGLQGRTAPASPGSTWEASLSPGNGPLPRMHSHRLWMVASRL